MARVKVPTASLLGDEQSPAGSARLDGLRVLVVDDHPLFREGLRHLVQGLGDNVGVEEAESFGQAHVLVAEGHDFDLVLADLCMPDEDGFEGLRKLHEEIGEVPVVVISVLENRGDVLRALDCGAKGFIPKSSNRDVILSALRLVHAGGVYLPPVLLGDDEVGAAGPGLSEGQRMATMGARVGALTPRQLDVLGQLGKGKSNREIARDLGLAEGTVKVHVTAVLKALGVKNRTQAVLASTNLDLRPND